MIKRIIVFCFLIVLYSAPAISQISLVQFSTGYILPVDIKNCGDDRMFIVEQRGTIQIVDTGGIHNALPFINIQSVVKFGGKWGMLNNLLTSQCNTDKFSGNTGM